MAEFNEDFKVGDIIEILREPSRWSSTLCDNRPFDLIYPQKFKIEEIKWDNDYTAMRAKRENGKSYGFSLSNLIKNNNIS